MLFFSPLRFIEYQLYSQSFWIVYTIYSFGFAIVLTLLAARGVRIEKYDMAKNQKSQRKLVAQILLPPMYYWLISVFLVNMFHVFELFDFSHLLQMWQFNVFIVLICIAVFIIYAFRDGFMGLKFVTQKSDWDSNMSNVNANAAHASHVLNTHTINMKSSIYLLEVYNKVPENNNCVKVSERLKILSNSISYLEDHFDRIKHHSQSITLKNESASRVMGMLKDAETAVRSIYQGISATISVSEEDAWWCDRVHMTEVFINIIKNAAEAMSGNGKIEITGVYGKAQLKHKYQLRFKDHGDGIDTDRVEDIFKPFSTSKSKEKNLGLGLSYCRNVVIAHGGRIFVAESVRGKGTTIGIDFPSKRVRSGSAFVERGKLKVESLEASGGGQAAVER